MRRADLPYGLLTDIEKEFKERNNGDSRPMPMVREEITEAEHARMKTLGEILFVMDEDDRPIFPNLFECIARCNTLCKSSEKLK